jgi:hypothetical protein
LQETGNLRTGDARANEEPSQLRRAAFHRNRNMQVAVLAGVVNTCLANGNERQSIKRLSEIAQSGKSTATPTSPSCVSGWLTATRMTRGRHIMGSGCENMLVITMVMMRMMMIIMMADIR